MYARVSVWMRGGRCACVFACEHVCVCICVLVCINIYICMSTSIHVCACVCVCACVRIYLHVCVCGSVHKYVYIYICLCVQIFCVDVFIPPALAQLSTDATFGGIVFCFAAGAVPFSPARRLPLLEVE